MARLTGGQVLTKSLIAQGVDTIFALPGMQLDHLFAAFHDDRNSLRVVHTRHEQGAAYMAFGYAQSSGRIGAYAVVPGPGVLNTTAALATAWGCSTPVMCVTGQIPLHMIDRGIGFLHEIPDQIGLLRHLTKYAARADQVSEIPHVIEEAFRQLRSGRPRPCAMEVPLDVLPKRAEIEPTARTEGLAPPAPDPDEIARAAEILGKAECPLIFIGGGAVHAAAEVEQLARMLEAPVIPTRPALGAISDRSDLVLPMQGGHDLWGKADAAIAIGTRFDPPIINWGIDAGLQIVRIDIDPVEITRVHRPAASIAADAREALRALLPEIAKHNRKRAPKKDERLAHKADIRKRFEAKVAPQIAFIDAMRAALPEDGFFVEEITQIGYVSRFMFPIWRPRGFVTSGFQGTLGFGLATALGAKVANPDKKVLAIAGDGGFMFQVQEMSTAVRHGIDITVVLFNDGHFGNVRRIQKEVLGGKEIAVDFRNPDFMKLAESFGWNGARVHTAAELQAAVAKSFTAAGPTLIEVPVGEFPSPWSFWHLAKVRPLRLV
jgi:acetolactate synthase-1/2/3 large subunit